MNRGRRDIWRDEQRHDWRRVGESIYLLLHKIIGGTCGLSFAGGGKCVIYLSQTKEIGFVMLEKNNIK